MPITAGSAHGWRPAGLRAVVLDVDGTLYDARALRLRLLPELLALALRPGGRSTLRILRRFRRDREALAEEGAAGIRRLQYERPAAALRTSADAVEAAVRTWMHERPLRRLRGCRYPGVAEAFDAWRRAGITLAVLSDYPAAKKLAALGLEADLVVSGEDAEVDRLKPDAGGLRRILDLLGLDPRDCLLIGDRDDRDGECARRVGMPYRLKARRSSADGLSFRHFLDLLR